jgi:hypothetical protein
MTIVYISILLAVLLVYLCWPGVEHYSSKDDRARRVVYWAGVGPHTYKGYKDIVGGTIVEYEGILKLSARERKSIDSIKKIL